MNVQLKFQDHFGATFIIFALAILQIVGIIWIYGLDNFSWDIEFMLGRKVTAYWRVSWGLVTPGIMIIIFIYNIINLENPTYGDAEFPSEYIVAGWIIFTLGISQIVIWFVWVTGSECCDRTEYASSMSALKRSLRPTEKWGPRNEKQREDWLQFRSEAQSNKDLMIQQEEHNFVQQIFYTFTGRYSNLWGTLLRWFVLSIFNIFLSEYLVFLIGSFSQIFVWLMTIYKLINISFNQLK